MSNPTWIQLERSIILKASLLEEIGTAAPLAGRLSACLVCRTYASFMVDRTEGSAQLREDTHLALPPTDRFRMSLAGMLGIFSNVLFWRTSRLGAILVPMWGAMSPHLQPTTQPLSCMLQ